MSLPHCAARATGSTCKHCHSSNKLPIVEEIDAWAEGPAHSDQLLKANLEQMKYSTVDFHL